MIKIDMRNVSKKEHSWFWYYWKILDPIMMQGKSKTIEYDS